MKTIAHLKVSTPQQDAGSQRPAILEYARKHSFQISDFVEAAARGQATAKHRWLDELIGILNLGNRLVVSELSRLGRSLGQIVTVPDGFAKAGVAIIAIKENVRVEGKQGVQTNVMITLIALFAETHKWVKPRKSNLPCPSCPPPCLCMGRKSTKRVLPSWSTSPCRASRLPVF